MISISLKEKGTAIAEKRLTQWDFGQKIKFTNAELPDSFQVHFCTENTDETVVVNATSNIVDIPNKILGELCSSCVKFFVYAKSETEGTTLYKGLIYIDLRQKPSDYSIPTTDDTTTDTDTDTDSGNTDTDNDNTSGGDSGSGTDSGSDSGSGGTDSGTDDTNTGGGSTDDSGTTDGGNTDSGTDSGDDTPTTPEEPTEPVVIDKAIMCFVDDDAQTGSNNLYAMLEELEVPYGISVPVSTIGTSGHLNLTQLNTHKSNGADILLHGALGSEDFKTMSLDDIKNSIDTALTFADTNNYNKEIFVYPSGLQPTTNAGNMTDVFDYMLSKGIKYGMNVNTVGESSNTSGVEDWYTYENGQACAGVWNKIPFVDMPNDYSKALLLNRQQYSSNFFYKRKSYWFNNIQNLINSKGIMIVFTHGYNMSANVTTYDGTTKTLLESYKDFIQYIQTECADTIEILSPISALEKIKNSQSS